MAVYVDDSAISATVGPHVSRWSHLFADSQAELHEFARSLGLRREWFQPGRPRVDGSPSPHWHYDVTEGKRMRAIQLGARPVSWRDTPAIMAGRDERNAAQQEGRQALAGLASEAAERAWSAGDLPRAASLTRACTDLDPARENLWEARRARLAEEAGRRDLRTQTAVRLALAGITADDPAPAHIRQHNAAAARAAGVQLAGPEAEAGQ